MPTPVELDVQLIGHTQFHAPADIDWETDTDGTSALLECAARARAVTWDKRSPHTATLAARRPRLLDAPACLRRRPRTLRTCRPPRLPPPSAPSCPSLTSRYWSRPARRCPCGARLRPVTPRCCAPGCSRPASCLSATSR